MTPPDGPGSSAPDPVTPGSHPELDTLVATIARLRGPGGCPWDGAQTHASLVRYLVEECAELVEAIEIGTAADLREELGDVLIQVLFHADLAAYTPSEGFSIEDVAAQTTAKLVGRHPHVFAGTREAETPDDVMAFWDDLKAAEKPERTSVLDGIPREMSALARAAKVLERGAKVGTAPPVHQPAAEDSAARNAAADDAASEDAAKERERAFGDDLLVLIHHAATDGIDPERALRQAVRRYEDRIRVAEAAGRPSANPASGPAPAPGPTPAP